MTLNRTPIVQKPLREIMSVFLITIRPFDTVARAFEIMSVNHIRHLPVVDDNHLIGILSWSDILQIQPPDPAKRLDMEFIRGEQGRLTASAVMTRDVITVFPQQPLGHAAELMLEHKIGALPVVDSEEKLVGLITESNLFRAIARRWREDNVLLSGAREP